MATKRTQALESAAVQSEFISGSCDGFALRDTPPKQQWEITAVAYDLWVARAFQMDRYKRIGSRRNVKYRNGSTDECHLQASASLCRRRRKRLACLYLRSQSV